MMLLSLFTLQCGYCLSQHMPLLPLIDEKLSQPLIFAGFRLQGRDSSGLLDLTLYSQGWINLFLSQALALSQIRSLVSPQVLPHSKEKQNVGLAWSWWMLAPLFLV